jgi:hypothetical protein
MDKRFNTLSIPEQLERRRLVWTAENCATPTPFDVMGFGATNRVAANRFLLGSSRAGDFLIGLWCIP